MIKMEPAKTLHKKCTKCGRELPLDNYARSKTPGFKDGRTYWCRDCVRDYDREYRKREDVRAKGLIRSRKWQRKVRREALDKLCGGEPYCAICGFKGDLRLLQLDHIKDDGNEERQANKSRSSYMIYKKISAMPIEEARERYQVLCIIHNWLGRYGDRGNEYALVRING